MTDRHSGYIVTLAEDIREDDAKSIITALRQLRGVIAVEPMPSEGSEGWNTATRVRVDLSKRLIDLGISLLRPSSQSQERDS